jgi:hypothetical protein
MSENTNTKCPVCGHDVFEQILVAPALWIKDRYTSDAIDGGKAIDTYRCGECHYIMFFATDDHISKRTWKYYHDKGLG